MLIAAALAAATDAGQAGRSIILWSGPWGWAVQPATGAGLVEWLAALSVLTLITAAAAALALRDCGRCPTERHLRRAEGRASATASLASFDARTARQALQAVGARPSERPAAGPGWLRAMIAARGANATTGTLAIVWRDTVAAVRTPGRVAEAAALSGAGAVLCLLNAERLVAVAAATMLVYVGASRMLWPLRAELDIRGRARVLLRPRLGRVLLAHSLLPVIVTTAAAVIAVAGCAILGALPVHGAGAVLAAVAVPAVLTWCAAMSARRGGRLPHTVLVTAVAVDPSGGGIAILSGDLLADGRGTARRRPHHPHLHQRSRRRPDRRRLDADRLRRPRLSIQPGPGGSMTRDQTAERTRRARSGQESEGCQPACDGR